MSKQDLVKAAQAVGTGLAEMIPGFGVVKNLNEVRVQKSLKLFFDELSSKGLTTEELEKAAENNDLLSAILCATHAAAKARSDDKAVRFARLLTSFKTGELPCLDELEECSRLLDSISDREWLLLSHLTLRVKDVHAVIKAKSAELDARRAASPKNSLGSTESMIPGWHRNEWLSDQPKIAEKFGITVEQLGGLLVNLQSHGLVRLHENHGWGNGPDDWYPILLPAAGRLIQFVEAASF